MRVAIVHDDLMRKGGAEKVALTLSSIYPEAPIFTLAYRPELTYPEFKNKRIYTSWFQPFARNEFLMKWLFFPIGIMAMKSINLKNYDLVIMSTTYCAKYVKIAIGTKTIAYCYTPFRLAWNPESYHIYQNSKGVSKILFDQILSFLRKLDRKAAGQIHYFVAMTSETRQRLKEAYEIENEIPIINPSVELGHYSLSEQIGDYYLLVSRFEPYKKVDLVIEAFNISKRRLIIVGKGSQERKLKRLANSNIEFKQNLSNKELADLYTHCRAFIFPQHEDYGLTPIEANAAGRPVIAYGKGGVLDTMIPYQENPENATAYFFYEQSVIELNNAIEKFENLTFVPEKARENAERFSKARFKEELRSFIERKCK